MNVLTRFVPRFLFPSFVLFILAWSCAEVLYGAAPAASPLGGAPRVTGQAIPSGPFKLLDGTPVKLRLQRTVSSADAHVDERIDFDVLEEIKVNDVVVVPKGAIAWGTVTQAKPKGRMGRGGKLDINIDAVRLADGEKAALRGVRELQGGGKTGAMTGGIVATSLIVWPAAPFFLFMHGKDITIPKGTEITVYINGDMELSPPKFGVRTEAESLPAAGIPSTSGASTAQPPPTTTAELASVVIKSTPEGADITVDGKYVGNAPSTLRLPPGEHNVFIEKSGFKSWQRTISLSPGSIVTIDAALESR